MTSAAFSPCLKKGIGLCYITKKHAAGKQPIILTDGKVEIKAVTEKPPLLKK